MISARGRPAVVSVFTFLATLLLPASATTAAVERTVGAASVSAQGASQYVIPLTLPSGREWLDAGPGARAIRRTSTTVFIGIGWSDRRSFGDRAL